MRDDHGPDAKRIGRSIVQVSYLILEIIEQFPSRNARLIGFIEERPSNVSSAVPQEEHGVGDDFLSMA